VRDDLGVGLGSELVARRLELGLELGEVLDDAVVDHEDLAVAVSVRVGVDVGRLPWVAQRVWPMPRWPVGMSAVSLEMRVSTLASDLVRLVWAACPGLGSSRTATPAES